MNRAENAILVEGDDDVHFLLHLLYRHGFARADSIQAEKYAIALRETGERIELKAKDGYHKVAAHLRLELTPSYLRRLAVIVDANADPQARWNSLGASLQHAGYGGIPAHTGAGAIISEAEKPVVGVWLMPGNARAGYLEDLVADMIPPDDVLWPRAQGCVASIPIADRRFSELHYRKAEVHTWLAWQAYPGTRISTAITRNYVAVDCPEAEQLVAWIRQWLSAASMKAA
jgi:hypothetical protein